MTRRSLCLSPIRFFHHFAQHFTDIYMFVIFFFNRNEIPQADKLMVSWIFAYSENILNAGHVSIRKRFNRYRMFAYEIRWDCFNFIWRNLKMNTAFEWFFIRIKLSNVLLRRHVINETKLIRKNFISQKCFFIYD